jgi:SAM-dependent methyltransferase
MKESTMSDPTDPSAAPNPRQQFLARLRSHLDKKTFVKLVLGKYRGPEPALKRVAVRQLELKGQPCLSFVTIYATQEMTKNTSISEGLRSIDEHLGNPFRSAHLFTETEEIQIEFSKKGKCFWNDRPLGEPPAAPAAHNREKERLLDPSRPFLTALGITDERHQVRASMSRKWKQINKFLELFQHAFTTSALAKAKAVQVVDFGSGKGYLTFAIHDLLRNTLGIKAQVTGIELREELVTFCNEAATSLSLEGLTFHQGDLNSYTPESLQVMIALHACDTATDQALSMGIRAGADMILCAPCCHKQLRPQMRPPEILAPLLKHGIHLGQEAEMLTDGLRALLLEAHGYRTGIQEFISMEHTSKNKMILAVKQAAPTHPEELLSQIESLKAFYGIREHCLESLLDSKNP